MSNKFTNKANLNFVSIPHPSITTSSSYAQLTSYPKKRSCDVTGKKGAINMFQQSQIKEITSSNFAKRETLDKGLQQKRNSALNCLFNEESITPQYQSSINDYCYPNDDKSNSYYCSSIIDYDSGQYIAGSLPLEKNNIDQIYHFSDDYEKEQKLFDKKDLAILLKKSSPELIAGTENSDLKLYKLTSQDYVTGISQFVTELSQVPINNNHIYQSIEQYHQHEDYKQTVYQNVKKTQKFQHQAKTSFNTHSSFHKDSEKNYATSSRPITAPALESLSNVYKPVLKKRTHFSDDVMMCEYRHPKVTVSNSQLFSEIWDKERIIKLDTKKSPKLKTKSATKGSSTILFNNYDCVEAFFSEPNSKNFSY